MNESSLLRIAMVMQNQSARTVDKYICKLVECVLFYSKKPELTSVELCKEIKLQFQLEFDSIELESALKKKSRKRVLCIEKKYTLSPRVMTELARMTDPVSLLEYYVKEFVRDYNKDCDPVQLLNNVQRYLYHAYNSSAANLSSLLNLEPLTELKDFSPTNEIVQQINDFISWENNEKNKLLYQIVSFSYEYCLLTTKKDSLLSRKLFLGKKFFLDTNIIFRMAGINKEERKFVIDSFVKKCAELSVELYYTSETLSELYTVIDTQVYYIRRMNCGQAPVSPDSLQKMSSSNESNDFYVIYYNWCKDKQNQYDDYEVFHSYLRELINEVLINLKYVDISNKTLTEKAQDFTAQCDSLYLFKTDKKNSRAPSEDAVKSDIRNIIYVLSMRTSQSNQSLWQTNEYMVSADQVLTTWAKKSYKGVPVVVIPSTWLSIMLRFTGRTNDDYKSYCLFMGLRQHQLSEDNMQIEPMKLLDALSKKTSVAELKQKIIDEVMSNKCDYVEPIDDYDALIDNAFDLVLEKSQETLRREYTEKIQEARNESKAELQSLKVLLEKNSAEDESGVVYATNKAKVKVDRWRNAQWLKVVIPIFLFIMIVFFLIGVWCKIAPIYLLILGVLQLVFEDIENINIDYSILLTSIAFIFNTLLGVICIAPLDYLGSDARERNLRIKYQKEYNKYLK